MSYVTEHSQAERADAEERPGGGLGDRLVLDEHHGAAAIWVFTGGKTTSREGKVFGSADQHPAKVGLRVVEPELGVGEHIGGAFDLVDVGAEKKNGPAEIRHVID